MPHSYLSTSFVLGVSTEFTYNALKTYSAMHRHNTVNATVKIYPTIEWVIIGVT